MNNYYNMELVSMLKEALADEENAVCEYYGLAEKAPNDEYKRMVLEIRKDEMGHALKLRKFITYFTKMMHSGDIDYRDCEVKDFRTGVKAAIQDEEGAAVSYKKIMDAAMYYPEIFYTIAEIRKDEQSHALLLRSLLD